MAPRRAVRRRSRRGRGGVETWPWLARIAAFSAAAVRCLRGRAVRVQLVREEGRDVSSQYGRGGGQRSCVSNFTFHSGQTIRCRSLGSDCRGTRPGPPKGTAPLLWVE